MQPYPGPGGKWLISNNGGIDPAWSADGTEIFYRHGDEFVGVAIRLKPAFQPGLPKRLFEGRYEVRDAARNYDVSPDGRRFVLIRPDDVRQYDGFQIVLNWFDELKAQVPGQ